MAGLNPWLAAAAALFLPLAAALWVGFRGLLPDRLVALEFASSLCIFILVLLSFAFAQPSIIDLPLALAFVSLPGTLVFTHFIERWL